MVNLHCHLESLSGAGAGALQSSRDAAGHLLLEQAALDQHGRDDGQDTKRDGDVVDHLEGFEVGLVGGGRGDGNDLRRDAWDLGEGRFVAGGDGLDELDGGSLRQPGLDGGGEHVFGQVALDFVVEDGDVDGVCVGYRLVLVAREGGSVSIPEMVENNVRVLNMAPMAIPKSLGSIINGPPLMVTISMYPIPSPTMKLKAAAISMFMLGAAHEPTKAVKMEHATTSCHLMCRIGRTKIPASVWPARTPAVMVL